MQATLMTQALLDLVGRVMLAKCKMRMSQTARYHLQLLTVAVLWWPLLLH